MGQEDAFDVTEATGLVVNQLFGFSDASSDEYPERMVIVGQDGRRFAFFLSAFLGHWDRVDDEAYDELLGDYAASRKIDYGAAHGLLGAKVVQVRCFHGEGGIQIVVRFDRGELTLTSVDRLDPHSQSHLSFTVLPLRR